MKWERFKIISIVLVVVYLSIVYPSTSFARRVRQEVKQSRNILGYTIPADEKVLYTEEEFHNVVLTNEAVYFSKKKGWRRTENVRIPYTEIRGMQTEYKNRNAENKVKVYLLINGKWKSLFLEMRGVKGYYPYPDQNIIDIIREQVIKYRSQEISPANTHQISRQIFERLQDIQPTLGKTSIFRSLLYNNEALEIAEEVLGEKHINVLGGRQSHIRFPQWLGTRHGSPVFLFPNWIFKPYSGRQPSLNKSTFVLINRNDIKFIEQKVTYKYYPGSSGSPGGMHANGGTYSGTSGTSPSWEPESFELAIYTPEGRLSQFAINSLVNYPIKDGDSFAMTNAYYIVNGLLSTLTNTDDGFIKLF